MSDSKASPASNGGRKTFKEAVCIDTPRVYDSCSDKDCFEDLRVYFPDEAQESVNNAAAVKSRTAELYRAYLDVEPVQFNRGFYSVDITFVFRVTVELYKTPNCRPSAKTDVVTGFASFSKKVILFGSEGNIKIFSSDYEQGSDDEQNEPTSNTPRAVLEAVDPVFLSARIVDRECTPESGTEVPEVFANNIEGAVGCVLPTRIVLVTLGLFSIVKLERNVQMLIPAYDFCVPDKECATAQPGDPCELFQSLRFPVDEFFPPRFSDLDPADPSCGCGAR